MAAGAVCRTLLAQFGVEIGSHVVELGGIVSTPPSPIPRPLNPPADASPVRCLDPGASARMVEAIDAAKQAGYTLGGVAEVVVNGLVVGLGSHVSWDRKLDGRLARALMSIPAIKGVGIGLGFRAGDAPGSVSHDEIFVAPPGERLEAGGFTRPTNRAGGLEGGITTGEPLVLRVAKKPISTLMTPLRSVNIDTGEEAKAQRDRKSVV